MKLIVAFLILINFSIVYSQVPTLDWAVANSGNGYDIGTGVVVDDLGNSYSIGSFTSQTDFDPGSGVYNLTPVGAEDIFIQKLNNSGQFVWAIQIGGVGLTSSADDDNAAEICLDHNNDLLITGQYGGAGDFDPSSNNFILTSNGYADCFVAKYTNNGSLIWAKSIGGGNNDSGRSIAVLSNNDVIISGQFCGPIDFDPGSGSHILTPLQPYSNGSYGFSSDLFTLKLNSSGDFIWAKINGDYTDDTAYTSTDSNDNIYQIGRFAGIMDIDPNNGVLNLNGGFTYYSTFIRKLNSSGDLIWAKSFTSSISNAELFSLTIDNNNDVIVTGFFYGTMDVDPSVNVFNITCNGSSDCLTLKLNANGEFLWAKTIGGNALGMESGSSITTDENNCIYVVGYIESPGSTIDFDNGPNSYFLADENGTFLVKYHSNGDLLWAIRLERSFNLNEVFYCWTAYSGGGGFIGGKCIDVKNNSIYVSGAFSHTVDFDPSSMDFLITTTGSANSTDIFLHKLNECTPFNGTIDTTCCSFYTAPDGQVYTASGSYNCNLTNPNGCDTSYLINLTINQPPSTPIVTLTNNVELSTQNQNNSTYQWVFCSDNLPISGAINPTFTALENSLYYVIVTNNCGSDTSECATVNTIGFSELNPSTFQVFPNPSNGLYTIIQGLSTEPTEMYLSDVHGRILMRQWINKSSFLIDIQKYKPGTYFIHFGDFGVVQIMKE